MTINKLKSEFLETRIKKSVWERLSSDFPWNEELLERHKDKLLWKNVCRNKEVFWSVPMLEKFKDYIDWEQLSSLTHPYNRNRSRIIEMKQTEFYRQVFTAEILEKYKMYWDWSALSIAIEIEIFENVFDLFLNYWDWRKIINNHYLRPVFDLDFFCKYREYIPLSSFEKSDLWWNLVKVEEQKIMEIITQK